MVNCLTKVGIVSLGCSKNKVDTEIMLGILQKCGYEFTNSPQNADILIVNTCGFIESAKQESINTILEMAKHKSGKCEKLIVTGCLSQRYKSELVLELPEVDIFLGVDEYEKLPALLGKQYCCSKEQRFMDRMVTTGNTAYLRIADGCDNKCSYCAIPGIRGRFVSRNMQDIIAEARSLCKNGAKELIIIAQDTTGYGLDIHGHRALPQLLRAICEVDCEWIRVMYTYPDDVSDELIEVIASNPKIVNYIDFPIQHCNDEILSRMNRRGSKSKLIDTIGRLQRNGITIRTSLITGFPGETIEQFEEMREFLQTYKLDRVGVFTYSPEDGTRASAFECIDHETAEARMQVLMQDQILVSAQLNKKRIGKTYKTLIEEYDEKRQLFVGRTYAEAPEVDGSVLISAPVIIGNFYDIIIKSVMQYDLIGELNEHS